MARQISCEKVHELLSEYVDGSLEIHLSDIIDNHLVTCDRCSQEVYSLEKVVNTLKSLETVKAPENFLENVHERIKSVTFLDKVIKTIHSAFNAVRVFFTYDHMRLSFQFIAFAVVLIAAIFSIREIIRQPSHLPLESEKTETVRLSDKEVPGLVPDEKKYTTESDREDFPLEENVYKKGHVITIALLLKDKKSDIPYARSFEKQREVGKKKAPSSALEGGSMSDTLQRQPLRQKSQAFEDRIMKTDKKEYKSEEAQVGSVVSKDEASLTTLSDALAEVNNLIKSVGGTVTSYSPYDEHSKKPLFVEATIPARNFPQFTKKLKLIGTFKDSLPQLSEQHDLSISVTIQFFSSQK